MIVNTKVSSACLSIVLLLFIGGCACQKSETGYSNFNKVQLQFYAPEGATVMMGDKVCHLITPDRSHQINMYGDPSYRLEHEPEETATFNLYPGHYEFKYTSAPGWEGASIYGNIKIYNVCPFGEADNLIRKTFIPIALPSPGTPEQMKPSDDIYPYVSPAHRLRISYQDVDRIQAGDMVTKVIFVADLKKAQKEVDDLELQYTCMLGEQQRLRALLCEARLDALEDPCSKCFIELQCKLKELDMKIVRNRQRATKLNAILRADDVLTRKSMLVMGTDEILPTHEDPVAAANELGTVLVVMRLGGRHNHWGKPSQEAAVYNK